MATREKITLAEINQMNKGALKSTLKEIYLAWKNTPDVGDVGDIKDMLICYKR